MNINPGASALAEQARGIKSVARQEFEQIRNDTSLSAEGKTKRLTQSWVRHRKQVVELERRELVGKRERRDTLRRELFGVMGVSSGVDLIARRDAMERASRIATQDEAERLLGVARRSGDEVLAQAVAERAFESRWSDAVEEWAGGTTDRASRVNELRSLSDSRGTADMAALIAHADDFTLDAPNEVAGLPQATLEHYAGEPVSTFHDNIAGRSDFGRSDREADYRAQAVDRPELVTTIESMLGGN